MSVPRRPAEKTENFTFKLSKKEKELLEEYCKQTKSTRSEVMRELLNTLQYKLHKDL